MEENTDIFKVFPFATNRRGDIIFCRLAMNNKTLIKGFYDFKKEKFFITKYIKENFKKGIGKNTAKQKLKKILLENYDWEL